MNVRFLALCLLGATAAAGAETLFKDDFSNPKPEQRRAARGDWKFAEGVATCTQDDALFKKSKDHGPILFYNLPLQDARIRFAYKVAGAKTVVFTANGADGHIFRFVISEQGTSIRAFPPGGDHASISLGNETPMLKAGEWVAVDIHLQGSKATVKMGDTFTKTYEHASLARPKSNISLGFSYGTLSVKDVLIEK